MLQRLEKLKVHANPEPWHLGMPLQDERTLKRPADDITPDEAHVDPTPSEDQNPADELLLLALDPARWHAIRQRNCVDSVLGYLRQQENIVLSPFSLMSCMAMMCRGASREQENALAFKELAYYCWPTSDEQANHDDASHDALSKYVTQLKTVQACEGANIIMANQLKDDYVADITNHFAAVNKEPSQWTEVNGMVRRITRMQSDIFKDKPGGSVLINAVYFEDRWVSPFHEKLSNMTFKRSSGDLQHVKTMTLKAQMRLAKHGHMTAVHMLYETPGMGAWFVKNSEPTTGWKDDISYDNLKSFILQEFVSQTLTSSKERLVVKVPQFNLTDSIDLKEVFQNVTEHKITRVFTGGGNLDRMTRHKDEYFSFFKQNCMLKVDPKGTTAAAVSFSGTTRGGPTFHTVSFAHTFYMVIHYFDTILFVAKIGSPTDRAESGEQPDKDTAIDTRNGNISAHFAQEEMCTQQENLRPPVHVCVAGIRRAMQIRTKLCDDKYDHVGSVVPAEDITDAYEDEDGRAIPADNLDRMLDKGQAVLVRTYKVHACPVIRVYLNFPTPAGLSLEECKTTTIRFRPIYVNEDGSEEPEEDDIEFKYNNGSFELPFPISKSKGDKEDGWLLRDEEKFPFLKIRFCMH